MVFNIYQILQRPTDSTPVPDGHYAEQSMMTTVVPNRNPIKLTIAFAQNIKQLLLQMIILYTQIAGLSL